MPVGKMDMVINIETPSEVKNSVTGEYTKTWSTWLVTWGEIMPKTSNEATKTDQITSIDEQTFRIRYESSITTRMRLYIPELARYYDILGISMEGRKKYLLLSARSNNVNAVA